MLVTRCNACGKLADNAKAHTLDGERIDLCPDCEKSVWVDWKHAPAAAGSTDPTRPPVHGRSVARIEADTLSGHGTPLTQA